MRPVDSQAKVLELAPLLDEALMRAKLAEFSKFGLPSGGGDGRGGERPLPLLGNTDRAILTARREYEQNLAHAALALDSAVRLQNAWCIPRLEGAEKAEKLKETKAGAPCKNVFCDRWMTGLQDDVPRNGYCVRCYRWEKRHPGQDWQPKLELDVPVAGTGRRAV